MTSLTEAKLAHKEQMKMLADFGAQAGVSTIDHDHDQVGIRSRLSLLIEHARYLETKATNAADELTGPAVPEACGAVPERYGILGAVETLGDVLGDIERHLSRIQSAL